MVAAVNLNIFHAHADRVRMTNIAQMVNVLQAMILTDKEKMLLTPTYHVFHMYKPFRGATQLPVELQAPQHSLGEVSAPTLHRFRRARQQWPAEHCAYESRPAQRRDRQHQSVGRDSRKGRREPSSRPPTMDAHNTFDKPETVKPAPFNVARVSEGTIRVVVPAKSIIVLSETGK